MYTGKPKIKVREMVKYLRSGKEIPDKYQYTEEDFKLAKSVVDSENYVNAFKSNGGKYLCARLRPGYIGCARMGVGNASYIQSERGKPYGTIVSIPNKKGTATIGVSYINPEDEGRTFPIIGLAIALRNAIAARDNGIEFIDKTCVRNKAKAQVEYFIKRSLAYFNPDVYSWSRGQDGKKIVYEHYDEIHQRRKMILGV